MRLGNIFALLVAALAVPVGAQQQGAMPPILKQVSITQRLNQPIPPNIQFRDEDGRIIRMGDLFGKRPILLSLVYFDCPALCTEVLNGELRTMKTIPFTLGKDFDAVTISFEPKDTSALAKAKRDVYAGQYGRPGARENWHFLTGDPESINAMTQALGFQYAYDAASRQYAHAAAIMLLTPDGRIARYFYGVQYPSRDLRLGLVEGSQGKISSPTDHALLLCYQYDPITGKYGLIVMNVVRAGGALTVLALGLFMFVMFRRERNRPGAASPMGAKVR